MHVLSWDMLLVDLDTFPISNELGFQCRRHSQFHMNYWCCQDSYNFHRMSFPLSWNIPSLVDQKFAPTQKVLMVFLYIVDVRWVCDELVLTLFYESISLTNKMGSTCVDVLIALNPPFFRDICLGKRHVFSIKQTWNVLLSSWLLFLLFSFFFASKIQALCWVVILF